MFKKVSERHQVCKQVASVFRQFMRLENKKDLNNGVRHEYRDYVRSKIDDILKFEA